jgi:hypothetical protein
VRRGRYQHSTGEIPRIRSAARAAEGKKVRLALVGRDQGIVSELLLHLDTRPPVNGPCPRAYRETTGGGWARSTH